MSGVYRGVRAASLQDAIKSVLAPEVGLPPDPAYLEHSMEVDYEQIAETAFEQSIHDAETASDVRP
jgi:hypothetical protein